jgi:hypothetical protein
MFFYIAASLMAFYQNDNGVYVEHKRDHIFCFLIFDTIDSQLLPIDENILRMPRYFECLRTSPLNGSHGFQQSLKPVLLTEMYSDIFLVSEDRHCDKKGKAIPVRGRGGP